MGIQRFEDCVAWQKAQDMAVDIYAHVGTLKDFGFRDQIQRAAVSISNNIAEGFDRLTKKDFIKYLGIAIGSCNETKSMLYLSVRLGYFNPQQSKDLIPECEEIIRILWGLVRALKNNPKS